MPNSLNNQKGTAPILLLLAALGILVFLFITNTFDFKNKLFSKLFPKPPSKAQEVQSVPDEILIKFKNGVDEKTKVNIRKHFGIKKDSEITQIGVEKDKVPEKVKDKIIEALSHNSAIQYAEPNYLVKMQANPNDPALPNQTNLPLINASSGWNIATGSAQVVVAILDTGVATNHEDLKDNLVLVNGQLPAADDNGHGTETSGIAVASTNNAKGIASLCWTCKLMSLKVLDSTGSGSDSNVAYGLIYAADNGAKIASMSLGGYATTQTMQDAINYAWGKGVVVIGAAGNDNTSYPFYPAASNNVISVGATDSTDQKASFSNFGSWIDVVAPGTGVGTTVVTGGYSAVSGTSMSAPQVSGLAGLIFSANPSLSNQQVVDIITSSAKDLGASGKDDTFGFGLIDAGTALSKATGTTPQPTPAPTPAPTPIPSSTDTTPPAVSISSPASGQTVSGTVNISANASDNVAVSSVSFFADGNLLGISTTSPYSYSWDTTKVSSGSHSIYASALDSSNNLAQSTTITVNVSNNVASPTPTPSPTPSDTTKPTVSITNPTGSTVKVNSKVNITASASDNVAVSKVEFYVGSTLKCTDMASPYVCSWSVPGKKGTNYNISAKAYDGAGNTNTSNIIVKSQ